MPSGPGERYDFFLSRRGSVAAVAQEVTDVLTEKGYGSSSGLRHPARCEFHRGDARGHEELSGPSRPVHADYQQSPYTRKEFTSFEAERGAEPRRAPHHHAAL